MNTNYDLGKEKTSHLTTIQNFFDDKSKIKPDNIIYKTKYLTEYNIITNNRKEKE
jgi:hypothetical protein